MAKTAKAVIETEFRDKASQGMGKFRNEMRKTEKQGKVLDQRFRFMRGGLGQVGHQFQDIAVQAQMGTNGMIIFGQQGSQIASLFGPGGAVFGAVIALGSALAMGLAPRLFGATEAMKQLKEASKGLRDRFDLLTHAQKAFVAVQVQKEILDTNALLEKKRDELEKTRREIKLNNEEEKRLANSTDALADAFKNYSGGSQFTIDVTRQNKESQEDLGDAVLTLNKDIDTLIENKKLLVKIIDGVSTAFEEQRESLNTQIATFGLSGHALREYGVMADLMAQKITHLEAAKLLEQSRSLEALEATEEARKVIEKERQDRQNKELKETEKALKAQEKTAQKFADSVGDGFVNAITGANSFKDAMKNVAKSVIDDLTRMIVKKYITDQIFGAIMNFTGNFNAQNPDAGMTDFNPGFNPEMIADGGGFTGRGARSGGLDGKGGFPAILHPNETVIDHTKGQSMGSTVVNQTINVTTGIQQTVRAEIQNLMPQIQEAAKAAVADSRMRGGSFSKAVRGA